MPGAIIFPILPRGLFLPNYNGSGPPVCDMIQKIIFKTCYSKSASASTSLLAPAFTAASMRLPSAVMLKASWGSS